MNTGFTEQEFNSMFDNLLDDVVRGSVEQVIQERQTYDYETLNEEYAESIEGLITDLLMEEETDEQDDQVITDNSNLSTEIMDALRDVHGHSVTTTFSSARNMNEIEEGLVEQELTDNENDVHEHQFTIIMGTNNEEMISRFERATNQLLLELVEPEQVDVVIFHLLSEQEQERVINHNVARLSFVDLQGMVQEIENMWTENEVLGVSVEQYLQQDLSGGIPTEEGVEPEPVEEEDEPVEEDEPEVEEEQQPVRRRRSSSGNDYTLAWDIYSLGYASGDVAHVYNLSAGSITRGMKDLGNEMRTGAETRAMRKVDPDEFSQGLLDRIFNLLEEKYETEEERNTAFYNTFNKNIYELTLHEAEDESLELQEMQEQANIQGVTLQDYVSQGLTEEVYEERERSEFVNNVRYLHETVKDKARVMFGDVNVDVGSVDVESKVSYENGVILTVKEAYKLDGKALDVSNVVFGVQIAEFIVQGFEREIEELINEMGRIVRDRFNNHSQVTRLGNRLVVGLDNE